MHLSILCDNGAFIVKNNVRAEALCWVIWVSFGEATERKPNSVVHSKLAIAKEEFALSNILSHIRRFSSVLAHKGEVLRKANQVGSIFSGFLDKGFDFLIIKVNVRARSHLDNADSALWALSFVCEKGVFKDLSTSVHLIIN